MAVRAVTGGESRGTGPHAEAPALRVVTAAAPLEPQAAPTAAPAPSGRRALPWRLYWAHVLGVFGLAASNILLGFAFLAAPLAGGWRRLLDRDLRPLLAALAAYVLLLGA